MNKGIGKLIGAVIVLLSLGGCATPSGAILSAADAQAMIQVTVVEAEPVDETLIAALD